MPAVLSSIDMLGLALVVVACLTLIVTLGSRKKPGRQGSGKEPASGGADEPAAVIPVADFQSATDRRMHELEKRLDAIEAELRRVNYELSKATPDSATSE